MPGEPIATGGDPVGTELADMKGRIAALESSNQWWPGMLAWTLGNTAPPGFLVADGSTYDTDRYAALFAAIGTATLPDYRDKFVIGAGNTYAVGAAVGANSVTLSAAQSGLPAHTHTTGVESATHTHGPSSGTHFMETGAGGGSLATGGATWTNVDHVVGTTTESATHTHVVNANSAVAASAPVSLIPSSIAALPLIHI